MSIKANPRDFLFTKVKQSAPERNGFDLSHENKQTCKAGYLYPFELLEALPGDDFEIQTETFIRLQAMLSPTMHRLKSYWHWFFIPNRLCWNYWEEFISRGNGKKLPAGQEYTPPEPVTMSLYDMIYSFTAYAFDDPDFWYDKVKDYALRHGHYEDDNEWQIWFGNLDDTDKTNILSQLFPILNFELKENSLNHDVVWDIFASTPRIATSMGIVDTCIYRCQLFLDYEDNDLVFSAARYYYAPEGFSSEYSNLHARLNAIKLSVMPLVAYALTYNDYYRDENLIEELDEMLNFFREETGALDMTNSLTLGYCRQLLHCYYRAWEKDYFTTATQMPQKAPDVLIPNVPTDVSNDGNFVLKNGDVTTGFVTPLSVGTGTGNLVRSGSSSSVTGNYQQYFSGLQLNNKGQGTTVADIRRSFALQRWFEKAVRTGTRYIETLKAFFNSDAGDARLQRPEYIGGTAAPVQISDVVQTSATADGSDTPQGNLAGYGVVSDNSEVMRYHAPEHGFVLGIFSILARTSYGQGVPKVFSRETWLDYAFPEFEHIGEQGVQNKELAAAPLTKDILSSQKSDYAMIDSWSSTTPNQFFGYQSRYSDYKQIQDRFGGAFSRSLDFWSLGRIFRQEPTLSQKFVEANISDRNFAVVSTDEEFEQESSSMSMSQDVDSDQYICDFWIDVKKVTSLTLFSEPI